MNNTQYIVVETRTEHDYRVFAEEHPEIVLGFYVFLLVVLIIGFIGAFFFSKTNYRKL